MKPFRNKPAIKEKLRKTPELFCNLNIKQSTLFDADRPLGLGRLDVNTFRQVDGQHAVLDFGIDLFSLDVVREQHGLLELSV